MKQMQDKLVFFDNGWSVIARYLGNMPYCYTLCRDTVELATFSNQRDARECLYATAQGVMRIENATAVFSDYYLALNGKRWEDDSDGYGGAWSPDGPSPTPRGGVEETSGAGASR